jgi:predicted PurR-regulated permease PerM
MTNESGATKPWHSDSERVASFVVLVGVIYLAYLTLRPVLLVVVLAGALATLTSRWFGWMVRRLRGRRRLAAVVLVVALVVGIAGLLITASVVIIARLVSEATALAHSDVALDTLAARLGPLGPYVQRAVDELRPQLTHAIPTLAQRAAQLLRTLGSLAGHLGIGLFLVAVTLYHFYLSGAAWREWLIRTSPLPPSDVRLFFVRFHQVSLAVLVGNLGTAFVQGVAATLGYWIIGAPAPLIFGLLTTFAALVPMVGTWLVWLPLALWLGLSGHWIRALILAGYGLLVVSTLDNLVRPLLTQRGLRENPLLIFLSVVGGLWSFGIAGLFVGPMVMALTITVVDLYAQKRE